MSARLLPALLVVLSLTSPSWADEPASKQPAERSVEELAKSARSSIVVVRYTGRDGKQQGLGTGFVVTRDGLIATNLHVIGEAQLVYRKPDPSGSRIRIQPDYDDYRIIDAANTEPRRLNAGGVILEVDESSDSLQRNQFAPYNLTPRQNVLGIPVCPCNRAARASYLQHRLVRARGGRSRPRPTSRSPGRAAFGRLRGPACRARQRDIARTARTGRPAPSRLARQNAPAARRQHETHAGTRRPRRRERAPRHGRASHDRRGHE